MFNVRNIAERINIDGICHFNFPLKRLTTFKVGGASELLVAPRTGNELEAVYAMLLEMQVPFTILGGGANVVVPDNGIPGVTLHTVNLGKTEFYHDGIISECGALISDVSLIAGCSDFTGLEFIYRMPGTVGGAVWMNARCYESSVSDVLNWVEYLDESGKMQKLQSIEGFEYKKSPFQNKEWIIYRAGFKLTPGKSKIIQDMMQDIADDREEKGHFRYPCGGSVFKNNRKFGKPSGQIIDELGLKGMSVGGAQIAPFHGNIIINRDNASADDIRTLTFTVKEMVFSETGFDLEPEIIFL